MRYIYYLLFVFGLFSCATTKPTSTSEPRSEIRFGTGGGFMGEVTKYCVLSDGKVFQQENFKITPIAASKKDVDQCFATCQTINFAEISVNEPGNTYSFIETKKGAEVHRVTWNPYQRNLPTDLVQFNNMLLELVGVPPLVVPPSEEQSKESMLVQPEKAIFSKVKPVNSKKSPPNAKNAMKKKKQRFPKYKQ